MAKVKKKWFRVYAAIGDEAPANYDYVAFRREEAAIMFVREYLIPIAVYGKLIIHEVKKI